MSFESRLKRARRRRAEVAWPIRDGLADAWFEVVKNWEDVRSFYRRHEWFRSLCLGVVALLVIVSLDAFSGHPVGFRFLFIVPVFVASLRGDWVSSALVTAATFLALMTFDSRYGVLDGDQAALGVIVNLVALAATSGFIVAMQRRIRKIHHIANHDALTGVMNRSAVHAHAEEAIRKAREDGTSVIVGLIDCDGFKRINDLYGHRVGDDVLIVLSRTLRRYMGRNGAVGRTGGDEFVMVIEGRSPEFASRLFERARQDYVNESGGVTTKRGFSYGFAQLGLDGDSFGELIQAADAKMYQDKTGAAALSYSLGAR
jgi:diguanylate cyclase (GGDEF)-like protein